jgi:hypothetical protein
LRVVVETDPELLVGSSAIGERTLPEGRIDPGACYDLRPEHRRAGIEHLDLAPDFVGPEIALFIEQFPNGCLYVS